MSDHIVKFRNAIEAAGIGAPNEICDDGRLYRFSSNGKRGDDSGWYVLHADDIAAGSFGCWRSGIQSTWCARSGHELTEVERQAMRERMQAMKRQREVDEAQRNESAAIRAAQVWDKALSATDHPYLAKKGIKSHSVKVDADGNLLVAMRDADGKLWNVERINVLEGWKKGLYGGKRIGCYYSIGKPKGRLIVCEGFATGASIHEATDEAVAVAFNAGNLEHVTVALRAKYPALSIIVAADDDHQTEGNPGMTKATAAAQAVRGSLAIPVFSADRPANATDFNDMALLYGAQAVRDAIACAGDVVESWPEIQSLMAHVEPEEYPLDALPASIRAAVEEVSRYVQAPLPLVASSALAAVSLATQAHADVQRDDKLQGPTSLFLLTIAASGERKSTCDGYFTQALRTYEAEQIEAFKPVLETYRADLDSWEMERAGVRDKIRQLAKDGKDVSKFKNDLRMLESDKPQPPRVPRLMYGDATPEALAHKLGTQYPSGGVMSAEAGTVLGSHGMSRESATRNLAQLNVLWDGGTLTIDRRTSESFTVAGARLTIGLMVQEAALQDFLSSTGDLARGSGFLARFLVAWPESTQGSRMYTAAPKAWPAVGVFNRRMDELLRQPVPMDDEGRLTPALMTFTPEAKAAWIGFYNVIEADLGDGGELRDVRDIASKTADNASRLAALFQYFEDGSLVIGVEAFEAGSLISAWHLYEARRFYGELAVPEDVADAVRLSAWLVQYCRRMHADSISMTDVQQNCIPKKLRKREALSKVIPHLVEAGHIQFEQAGKLKTIRVNPKLIKKGGE